MTWQSSNPNVFKVLKGTVTAHGAGTATLTATTQDGGFTATATVTVVDPNAVIPVTSMTVTPTAHTMKVGEAFAFAADVQPANATDQGVTWQSSDTNVFTVSGGTVTAHNPGTATLTVGSQDGGFTATAVVTVESNYVPVTG